MSHPFLHPSALIHSQDLHFPALPGTVRPGQVFPVVHPKPAGQVPASAGGNPCAYSCSGRVWEVVLASQWVSSRTVLLSLPCSQEQVLDLDSCPILCPGSIPLPQQSEQTFRA